jgi:hypothetical protein
MPDYPKSVLPLDESNRPPPMGTHIMAHTVIPPRPLAQKIRQYKFSHTFCGERSTYWSTLEHCGIPVLFLSLNW